MIFKYHNDTNILPKTAKSLIKLHNPLNIIYIMRKTLKNDPLPPHPGRCMWGTPHKYFLDFSKKKCDTRTIIGRN